jgi:hypothetical protein
LAKILVNAWKLYISCRPRLGSLVSYGDFLHTILKFLFHYHKNIKDNNNNNNNSIKNFCRNRNDGFISTTQLAFDFVYSVYKTVFVNSNL